MRPFSFSSETGTSRPKNSTYRVRLPAPASSLTSIRMVTNTTSSNANRRAMRRVMPAPPARPRGSANVVPRFRHGGVVSPLLDGCIMVKGELADDLPAIHVVRALRPGPVVSPDLLDEPPFLVDVVDVLLSVRAPRVGLEAHADNAVIDLREVPVGFVPADRGQTHRLVCLGARGRRADDGIAECGRVVGGP